MFILNEKPLSPDVAFEHDGIQYPANWIRLASQEEREAIGLTEVPDPTPVDQRFYWDTGIPKDHEQLIEQWVNQIKATASSLISPTDWMVTRSAEPNGKPVSDTVLAERERIRMLSNDKEGAIRATTSTEELAVLVTGSDFNNWNELDNESITE